MNRSIQIVLVFALASGLVAQSPPTMQYAPPVPKSKQAPELRLRGSIVRIPIVMVHEYPFLQGEAAGVKGKLMLDTGAEQALALNDHRVRLDVGVSAGVGHFGSGQIHAVRMHESVRNVHVGPLTFPRVTTVRSQDARQLEAITPDFIGWIGHYFWEGYALKLDYKRRVATFYRDGTTDFLRGEKVIAILPFELRKLPNQPLVPVTISGLNVIGAFDTGQYGTLYVDNSTREDLVKRGALQAVPNQADTFNLTPFTVAGVRIKGLEANNAIALPDAPSRAVLAVLSRIKRPIVSV